MIKLEKTIKLYLENFNIRIKKKKTNRTVQTNSGPAQILFVTSNKYKAKEALEIAKNKLGDFHDIFKIISTDSIKDFEEIYEIQDLDVDVVSRDKVMKIHQQISLLVRSGKIPGVRKLEIDEKLIVVCEDTGLYLEGGYMHNFPGAFFKQFCDTVGYDMCKIHKNGKAVAKTSVSFYDGEKLMTFTGSIVGKIIESPIEGSNGFGFDNCFIPNNYHITFSEMKPEQKNSISMRKIAFGDFFDWYMKHYIESTNQN